MQCLNQPFTSSKSFIYEHPVAEPFFKKSFFGIEEELFGTPEFANFPTKGHGDVTPLQQKQGDFPNQATPTGFEDSSPQIVQLNKADLFDYLLHSMDALRASCDVRKKMSLRQDLFFSAINAITNPQTDVVLVHLGQQAVYSCIESAINDLDIEFLNFGNIFLLEFHSSAQQTHNVADRKVLRALEKQAKQAEIDMQELGRTCLRSTNIREDTLRLGSAFKRTFIDFVFRARFEHLRNVRENKRSTKMPMPGCNFISATNKAKAQLYNDASLTCCPTEYFDPPKTPKRKAIAGYWIATDALPVLAELEHLMKKKF